MSLPIGEVARRSGLSPDALRYYEREGLLPAPERTAGGARRYDESALDQLAVITSLRAVGFSLAQVRDLCINLLRDVMSERGVQQRPLASTLQELLRICDVLNHHHQPAARELAAAIWRLYCALSQLEQAPIAGTIGEKTT